MTSKFISHNKVLIYISSMHPDVIAEEITVTSLYYKHYYIIIILYYIRKSQNNVYICSHQSIVQALLELAQAEVYEAPLSWRHSSLL